MSDLVILLDQREVVLIDQIQPSMCMKRHLTMHIRQQLNHRQVSHLLPSYLTNIQRLIKLLLVQTSNEVKL